MDVVINDDLRPGLNGAGSSVSHASPLVPQTGQQVIQNPGRRPRIDELYENKGKWSKERKREQRAMKPLQTAHNRRQKEQRKSKKRKIKEANKRSNDKRIRMWKVWGTLPPNLALEIYKRLPLQSFYRLREEPKEDDDNSSYLHGILTFHIASKKWRWKKLLAVSSHDSPSPPYKLFSVKGLTFTCDLPKSGHQNYGVFDTHTKNRNIVPREPETPKGPHALGMTVDTSVVPHTFKLILGRGDIGTQIYNSLTKSWETRSSLIPSSGKPIHGLQPSCLYCGNYVYIRSDLDTILVYSLEADMWSTLKAPTGNAHSLGSWQGCIFTVTCDRKATMWARTDLNESDEESLKHVQARLLPPLLWVWELVDESEQNVWKKVAEMPEDMQRWLIPLRLHEFDDAQIHTSFCDEHLLIYSWVPEQGRAYRFVLYNVATKVWEKVELVPNHSVSIKPDKERDTKQWGFPKDLLSMEFDDDDDLFGLSMMGPRGKSADVYRNRLKDLARGMPDYDSESRLCGYDEYSESD